METNPKNYPIGVRELTAEEIGQVAGGLIPLVAAGKVLGAVAGGFVLAGVTYGVAALLSDS